MKRNYLDPMMQNPRKLATLPTMKKARNAGVGVSTFREALPESGTMSARHEPRFSCSLRVGGR